MTAVELAEGAHVDPKRFRQALRHAKFPWHAHRQPWTVPEGSDAHRDMLRILGGFQRRGAG